MNRFTPENPHPMFIALMRGSIALLVSIATIEARAADRKLLVPAQFGDGMVLQSTKDHDTHLILQGWVNKNTKDLSILFGGAQKGSPVKPKVIRGIRDWQRWAVGYGDPRDPSPLLAGPFRLEITSNTKSAPPLVFSNAIAGDVWAVFVPPYLETLPARDLQFPNPPQYPLRIWSAENSQWHNYGQELANGTNYCGMTARFLKELEAQIKGPTGILLLEHHSAPVGLSRRESSEGIPVFEAAKEAWNKAELDVRYFRDQAIRDKRRGEGNATTQPNVLTRGPRFHLGNVSNLLYEVRGAILF